MHHVMQITLWHSRCIARGNRRGITMGANIDFEKIFPHHDLLVEIGRIEMAMEQLNARSPQERTLFLPKLESRMTRLRDALGQLAA